MNKQISQLSYPLSNTEIVLIKNKILIAFNAGAARGVVYNEKKPYGMHGFLKSIDMDIITVNKDTVEEIINSLHGSLPPVLLSKLKCQYFLHYVYLRVLPLSFLF